MSRDAAIERPFGDNDYVFRIAWGEILKLQEARDTGPYIILDRLLSGRWFVEDIAEVIRVGLIGGGLDPIKARKMVKEFVEARPPVENLELAQRVLGAGMVGAPDEEVGIEAAKTGNTQKIDDLPNGKLRFATIYGAGAAMGFSPEQINKMSVWHFNALVDGWIKANDTSGGSGPHLSETEKDEIWEWMQDKANGRGRTLQ